MTQRVAPKPRRKARAAPPRGAATATREEPAARTETQARIVGAAVGLFAERGFDGVTTAEISARAGVAEKTLFANFGSKERLYQAALRPATVWATMMPEALRTLAPVLTDPPSDPRALLRAVIENRVRFARAHRHEVKLFAQHLLMRPDGVRVLTDTWSERIAPLIMPLLDRLIASGALRDDIPKLAVVRFILTSVVGYVMTAVILLPDAAWDDEREIDHLVDVLTHGLMRRGPRRSASRAVPRKR